MGRANALIRGLASDREGHVARFQLLPLGISDNVIGARLRNGFFTLIYPGVYAVGVPNRSLRGRWWAAVLAGGPGSALAGRAAARLWGLRSEAPAVIDVITPTRRRAPAGLRFHHERLPVDEMTDEMGIPATTAIRTAFDLAASLQPWQTERVVNEIDAQQLWSAVSFEQLLARHPHRRGNPVIRRIVAEARIGLTRTHEGAEEETIGFLDRHGLPRPATTTQIDGLTATHEADCVWHGKRVNLEVDSRFHDTGVAGESDAVRDLDLEAAGWTVVRVRMATLRESPGLVLRRLRQLLLGEP